MYIQTEIARMLAQTKIEETRPRMATAAALRAASLERQSAVIAVCATRAAHHEEVPERHTARALLARWAHAPRPTNG